MYFSVSEAFSACNSSAYARTLAFERKLSFNFSSSNTVVGLALKPLGSPFFASSIVE